MIAHHLLLSLCMANTISGKIKYNPFLVQLVTKLHFQKLLQNIAFRLPIDPGNKYLLNLPSAQTKHSGTFKMDEMLLNLKKYSAGWSFISTFTKSDEKLVYQNTHKP